MEVVKQAKRTAIPRITPPTFPNKLLVNACNNAPPLEKEVDVIAPA